MKAPSETYLQELENQLDPDSINDSLQFLALQFPGRVTFSTSFSLEDQLITHTILKNQIGIKLFTLDTGRLFAETYSVWSSTNEKYQTKIKAYYPDQQALEKWIEAEGPNSFYASVENRKACCHIRKVMPLKRALAGHDVWVTGLRAEHSAARKDLSRLEWDAANQILKFHPLLHRTTEEISHAIGEDHIPYNPLHDRGFVSIGCAPCTRAIKPGEDFRAGRWWWEDNTKKECGLHESAHSQQPINS